MIVPYTFYVPNTYILCKLLTRLNNIEFRTHSQYLQLSVTNLIEFVETATETVILFYCFTKSFLSLFFNIIKDSLISQC